MSHFSKIKTNISNKEILIKTLSQMGFNYEYSNHQGLDVNISMHHDSILVYDNYQKKNHLFSFVWNNNQYNLVADLQLWKLDVNFDYFLDSLSQKYAYNVIVNQSLVSGFAKIRENVLEDGSIKVVLKRWSTNSCS